MLNLPIQIKHSAAPLLIMTISILFWIFEPSGYELLAFDRTSISHQQWWRLLSGHFLHTNHMHLLLNLAGLTLLWALHGYYYTPLSYLTLVVILCVGTSVGLYWFAVDLYWYVGLSGALHGLFIVGAYFDIRHQFKTGWIMLVGVWIKVIHEQIYGASEQVAGLIEANVAIDAHLFGTLVGSLIIFYYLGIEKLTTKKS